MKKIIKKFNSLLGSEKELNKRHCGITPSMIDALDENEIFVFGSNLAGLHNGGAASIAYIKFGAIWGQGVGLQGSSYAIPTTEGGVDTIATYVDQFIDFAKKNPQLKFLVTRIGCGVAGFKDKEIAPLFAQCLELSNVCLPQSFIKCLNQQMKPKMPLYMKQKIHGQTQTLVDLIIEMNKERPIHSPKEAMDRLKTLLNRFRFDGDSVAFNCSVRSFALCSEDCFPDGKLDAERLRKYITHDFYKGIEAVYCDYVVDKTIKLILYMNTFRRYTNSKQIEADFIKVTNGVNHCGPQKDNYYFSFGWYPIRILERYLDYYWCKFAPRGVLDNRLFRDFMIERHERGIEKYGLEAVIKRNFHEGCDPRIIYPDRGVSAPIYIKKKRGFVKSCSETDDADLFEFQWIEPLLQNNPDYIWNDYHYIPRQDNTLPVFNWRGMMEFDSEEEKQQFIREYRR